MKDVRVTVDQDDSSRYPEGRVDVRRIESTTDSEIQNQIDRDNEEAIAEMGEYIRTVRARVGMGYCGLWKMSVFLVRLKKSTGYIVSNFQRFLNRPTLSNQSW